MLIGVSSSSSWCLMLVSIISSVVASVLLAILGGCFLQCQAKTLGWVPLPFQRPFMMQLNFRDFGINT